MKLKRWLITGGSGFIGRNLIRYLLSNFDGIDIRVLDSDVYNVLLPDTVTLIQGDVRDPISCYKACQNMDVVIHLAGHTNIQASIKDPILNADVNVIGTALMLQCAADAGVKQFVMASSNAVFGHVDPPLHEEMECSPISPYGCSKFAGENYTKMYSFLSPMKTTVLRFSNVYGPYSLHKTSVVAKFFKDCLAKQTLVIDGDGSQTRDIIYVEDLIEAIVLAVQKNHPYQIYQIGTGVPTTIKELAELMCTLIKHELNINVQIQYTDPRPGEVLQNYSAIEHAVQELKWFPKTNLTLGLYNTFPTFTTHL